jgi:predicted PilT family ATPase
MSLHIKENNKIVRKKGEPGNWKPYTDTVVMTKEGFKDLVSKIYEEVENRDDGFLEIDRKLSKVLQL